MKLVLEREDHLSPYLLIFLFIFILPREKLLPVPGQLLEHSSTKWYFIAFFHAVLFLTGEPAGLPPALWETRMLD